MNNVFAHSPRLRRSARQLPVRSALILSSALVLPGTAWADCTPTGAPAGSVVTCTGNSASYTNQNSGLKVTADATAIVVAPLNIGANGTLTVATGGSITGSTAAASVNYLDNATITNNGTISASAGTAIQVGINSTVSNNGTLTAAAGTSVVSFIAVPNVSTNGSFTNGQLAPTAVTGNVALGFNIGANVGTFINQFNSTTTATSTATYGLNGNVTATGNVTIDNEGQWTGALSQGTVSASVSPTAPLVSFKNGATANFTGVIQTSDTTTLINNATGNNPAGVGYAMLLQNNSQLGAASTGSSLTNNGTLSIGSTTAPALVTINGNFTQTGTNTQTGVTPVLNMAIAGSSTTAGPLVASATEPYSQIYAIGGTAKLGGILNVTVVSGFLPVGSKYDLIIADQGISGSFSAVNVKNASSDTLPFIAFGTTGTIVPGTTAGQQYYEFSVQRVANYAVDIRSVATPNQLAIAQALGGGINPDGTAIQGGIVAVAEATATGTNETSLIGAIDQLSIAQATTLFDQLSPAGLLSYAGALRDEANNFERAINLRMQDQNSDHAEDGYWGTASGQVDVSKATADTSKQKLFAFNLGYDLSGPHHVFGVAANVTFDSLKNAGSTLTGHNRDYALAGYGGYDAGPIHLTGQVAYNFGRLKTVRSLTLGTVAETARGSASEHLFKATGTAGVMLHLGEYTFEPFGGIDFMRGKIKGFTETGDGAAALTVLPISADRTDVLAGLALTRSTGKLRPYVRAVYRSEIGNSGATTVSAYFDGNTATGFTVAGVAAARHEEDINAGLNWVFEDAGSLFVGYQGTLRHGFNSHGLNLGIRLEF